MKRGPASTSAAVPRNSMSDDSSVRRRLPENQSRFRCRLCLARQSRSHRRVRLSDWDSTPVRLDENENDDDDVEDVDNGEDDDDY